MSNFDLPRPLGPYTLLRRLASGGMAEVYLARTAKTRGFGKLVALKRLHPRHALDEGYEEMLVDEARLSASLSHRNIVQTLDLGRVEGSYVLVMEHVEGYDAQHVLDALETQGRLFPIDLAAHVVAELCQGLDYAHRHCDEHGRPSGIVHRDVSPQNLLLSRAGEVKIADFGIAKGRFRRRDSEAGVIKGKYFYMSPEQAWAEPVDHRSDIFSTGIVLWELLVGERLRQARSIRTLLDSVRRAEVPRPSSRRKEVPRALDAIVRRATAANATDRYENAGAMADALVDYLSGREPLYASRRIADLLSDLSVPPPAPEFFPAHEIPCTRDRVPTRSDPERPRRSGAPPRDELDDQEPTVSGRRAPRPPKRRFHRLWLLAAGATLALLAGWVLRGRGAPWP